MSWSEFQLRLIASVSAAATAQRGRLTVSGLLAGATIARDERGIPRVEARLTDLGATVEIVARPAEHGGTTPDAVTRRGHRWPAAHRPLAQ
ncbi:MAG: hypothetical protein ACRDTA_24015 [Pseudonocardiaceae bacterium]